MVFLKVIFQMPTCVFFFFDPEHLTEFFLGNLYSPYPEIIDNITIFNIDVYRYILL